MTEKDIDKAVNKYIKADAVSSEEKRKAFKAGAHWALNRLCRIGIQYILPELKEYINSRSK